MKYFVKPHFYFLDHHKLDYTHFVMTKLHTREVQNSKNRGFAKCLQRKYLSEGTNREESSTMNARLATKRGNG